MAFNKIRETFNNNMKVISYKAEKLQQKGRYLYLINLHENNT